jgi:hypothetical protein
MPTPALVQLALVGLEEAEPHQTLVMVLELQTRVLEELAEVAVLVLDLTTQVATQAVQV